MNIMRYRQIYFLISGVLVLVSVVVLLLWGLRPSIDFTGGTLIEVVSRENIAQKRPELERALQSETEFRLSSIQNSANDTYIIRGSLIEQSRLPEITAVLQSEFADAQVQQFAVVGPAISAELLRKTLVAVVLVASIITIYIWRQFKELKYGVCAVLAMLHDSIILLGVFSVLGKVLGVEVDILFVTALLTTLSFSIHDTIVVFDRIREIKRTRPQQTTIQGINAAITETLTRSLNNSLTIIIMLVSLVLLGGETLRWFAVALLVGAVAGTYSSTFTAAPLLLVWERFVEKKKL